MEATEAQQAVLRIIEAILKEHPRAHYVTDEAIANTLGVELQEARDYLELMEQNNCVTVTKTFGGWSAGLTAKGRSALSLRALQPKPKSADLPVGGNSDVQSKVDAVNALLRRTYDLVGYARSKRDSAPIALADRHHPAHVQYDRYFCEQREQLLTDIKNLLETGWNEFECDRFQSELERLTPSIAPGHSPGWKGVARCRCWWDAKDELQAVADYLQDLKSSLGTVGNEEMTKQSRSKGEETARRSLWLSGLFYLVAASVMLVLLIVAFRTVGIVGLPIVIIGTLLLVSVIGALQLRQDEALSQENFLSLMFMVYRQIPFLIRRGKNVDTGETEQNGTG